MGMWYLLFIVYDDAAVGYGLCEEVVSDSGFEIVGGDGWCNRTPPQYLVVREAVYLSSSFFLSIFSLNIL